MGASRHARILVVEDETLLRGLIAQFLRTEGFDVVEAADGREGVEQFAAAGPFDVVLLDLNLPAISGVEVCHQIKTQEPEQRVIICSAAVLDSDFALAALHVDQFLSKPYHPAELLNRIALELDRGQRLRADAPECAQPIYAQGGLSRRRGVPPAPAGNRELGFVGSVIPPQMAC